jgi:hypothetical protein
MDYGYGDDPGFAAGFFLFFGIVVLIYLALVLGSYVITSLFLARVFRKAGIEQWKAWVPVYNWWVFLELGGQPGWIAILAVVPVGSVVTAVFLCIAAYNIGIAFSKQDAWVLLYIFVPPLWLGLIGFDDSRWEPWRSSTPPIYGANIRPPAPPAAA